MVEQDQQPASIFDTTSSSLISTQTMALFMELAKNSSTLMAKVEGLRELVVDHKTSTTNQFVRTDNELRSMRQEQTTLTGNVAQTQRDIERKFDDVKTEALKTQNLIADIQKTVRSMERPVDRIRQFDTAWKNYTLAATVLFVVFTHFWPLIKPIILTTVSSTH